MLTAGLEIRLPSVEASVPLALVCGCSDAAGAPVWRCGTLRAAGDVLRSVLCQLWWQRLHCCPHSTRAVAAVSVCVGAAAWPFFELHSCSLILPRVRAAALPLWEGGANEEESVRLPPGLWVRSVSELSPWFCFCSQNGLGWLKQGRHLLMGLSLKEGSRDRGSGSCGGCSR